MRPAGVRRQWAPLALAAVTLALAGSCSSDDDDARPTIATDWSAGVTERSASSTPAGARPDDVVVTTAGTEPPQIARPSTLPATTAPPAALPSVTFDVDTGPGGFAGTQGLTGGLGGEIYVVTSNADSGPGTYREGLSQGDRIVRFDPSLDGTTIHLDDPVETDASNLTVDGSGRDVTISGHATRFSGTNVIVAGMHFSENHENKEDDAITFREPHDTQVFGLFGNIFEHASDGLVDIIWNRGHDVYGTICGNIFRHHDKAMLIDSGDDGKEGGRYHVTLCRNYWDDIYQRTPLSRRANVHTYNSVFERYGKPNGNGGGSKSAGDGKGVSQHLLEGNMVFPRKKGDVTFDGSKVTRPRTEWAAPQLNSDGAVRVNGNLLATVDGVTASETEHDAGEVFEPPYPYQLVAASEQLAGVIAATAGTCLPSGRADAIVPCAPLIIDDPDGVIEIVISPDADGSPTAAIESVVFVVGGSRIPGRRVDSNRWALDVGDLGVGPTPIWATASTTDGRSVESDLVLVSNVS
jgi:pectate lyase